MGKITVRKVVKRKGFKKAKKGHVVQRLHHAHKPESIMFIPRTNKQIAPQRMKTVFESDLEFYVPAATTQGFFVEMNGNNLQNPYNTGTTAIGTVAGTTITTGSGASATQTCSGFNNWFGTSSITGIYTSYLVTHAECVVDCYPSSLGDTLQLGIAAFNPAKPGDTPATLSDFGGKPYTVMKTFSSSKGATRLKLKVPVNKFFGLTWQQFFDAAAPSSGNELTGDYSGSYASSPVVNMNFGLFVQTMDNAVLATTCAFKVQMKYRVIMFNPRRNTFPTH